jgi:hypothetical protein
LLAGNEDERCPREGTDVRLVGNRGQKQSDERKIGGRKQSGGAAGEERRLGLMGQMMRWL